MATFLVIALTYSILSAAASQTTSMLRGRRQLGRTIEGLWDEVLVKTWDSERGPLGIDLRWWIVAGACLLFSLCCCGCLMNCMRKLFRSKKKPRPSLKNKRKNSSKRSVSSKSQSRTDMRLAEYDDSSDDESSDEESSEASDEEKTVQSSKSKSVRFHNNTFYKPF